MVLDGAHRVRDRGRLLLDTGVAPGARRDRPGSGGWLCRLCPLPGPGLLPRHDGLEHRWPKAGEKVRLLRGGSGPSPCLPQRHGARTRWLSVAGSLTDPPSRRQTDSARDAGHRAGRWIGRPCPQHLIHAVAEASTLFAAYRATVVPNGSLVIAQREERGWKSWFGDLFQ